MKFKTPLVRCAEVLKPLEKVSHHIDTVFNIGVISRVYEDGPITAAKILEDGGKTPLNLGEQGDRSKKGGKMDVGHFERQSGKHS